MAIFGIKLKKDKVVTDFVKEFNERLQEPDMLKNPFVGFIRSVEDEQGHYVLLYTSVVWPSPIMIALILLGTLLVAHRFSFHWSMLLLLPLFMVSFIYTNLFMKWAVFIMLRKRRYSHKIIFMKDHEVMLRLAGWPRST